MKINHSLKYKPKARKINSRNINVTVIIVASEAIEKPLNPTIPIIYDIFFDPNLLLGEG
jgi:hypothetical protein